MGKPIHLPGTFALPFKYHAEHRRGGRSRDPRQAVSRITPRWRLAGPEVLYQRPYVMTLSAQGRDAIEAIRRGSAVSAFQALQQASTMAV